MTKYFYSINGEEKKGPLSFEELKQKNITSETLIWHQGMDDWKAAGEILKLKPLFESPKITLVKPKKLVKVPETTPKPKMFSKVFSFKGRIRRLEYGLSFIIFYFSLTFSSLLAESSPLFFLILCVPNYWFLWAQGAKRCHDRGNTGWYQLIPFYVLWMLFGDSDIGTNNYGANPKGS